MAEGLEVGIIPNQEMELCRLCALMTSKLYLINIFDEDHGLELVEKIYRHLNIKITEDDGLPHGVCMNCNDKLHVCHSLVETSHAANKQLLAMKVTCDHQANQTFNTGNYSHGNSPPPISDDIDDLEVASSDMPEAIDPVSFCSVSLQLPSQVDSDGDMVLSNSSKVSITSCSTQIALLMAKNSRQGQTISQVKKATIFNLFLIDLRELDKDEGIMDRIARAWRDNQLQGFERYWSDNNSITCTFCGTVFPSKEELVSHFQETHPSDVKDCPECGETICGPVELYNDHLKSHTKNGQGDSYSSDRKIWKLIPLGKYNPLLEDKEEQASKILRQVVRCKSIHAGCKMNVQLSLKTFFDKFETSPETLKRAQCKICLKTFAFSNSLKKHIKNIHGTGQIRVACIHCLKMVRNERMNEHVEVCHFGGEKLLCVFCDKAFQATGKKQPHMMKRTKLPFKCGKCKRGFTSLSLLEKHVNIVHSQKTPNKKIIKKVPPPTKPVLCHECGKIFKSKDTLRKHIKYFHFPRKDETDRVVPCEMCDKTFASERKLYLHVGWVHLKKTVECEVCKKQICKYQLKKHMRTHSDPQFACKYCGKRLTVKSTLLVHEAKHEGTKVKCPICETAFASQYLLEKHQKIHFNDPTEDVYIPPHLREVQCELCNKILKNQNLYRHHMKSHELGHPLPVPVYNYICVLCNSKFSKQETLDYHMISCHSEGSKVTEMVLHKIRSRNQNELFKCQYCDKHFKFERTRKEHEIVKHTNVGEKNFSCHLCEKQFLYHAGINRHMRTVHGAPRSRCPYRKTSTFPQAP